MRILFVGCVESSYLELKLLLEHNKNIVGIITKEASNFNADFVDLKPLADQYMISCRYTKNINDAGTVEYVRHCQPDVIYCFGWSQLIKKEILDIPSLGVIGTHPSELPYNRGRHPIVWALALGLKYTASTFFVMDENADTGDIISQRKIKIEDTDYARDLYDKITKAECEQILEFTTELESGLCRRRKQDITSGNEWRKRGVNDGIIDWRMSAKAIYNLVRALSRPYVGAHFIYRGTSYKVWKTDRIETTKYQNIEPGKVIKVVSETDFYVKVYDGLIHIIECDRISVTEGQYLDI